MTRPALPFYIQPKSHPFPFLLQLEWVLIVGVIIAELVAASVAPSSRHPAITVLFLVGFGVMGLRIPQRPMVLQVAYTVLELLLIVLISTTRFRGLQLFPLLLLVVLIRSCLMFGRWGRLAVAGTTFGLFLFGLLRRAENFGFRGFGDRRNHHSFPHPAPFPSAIPGTPVSPPSSPPLGQFPGQFPPQFPDRFRPLVIGFALNAVIFFALALIFVLLLINALMAERKSRERLVAANEQLRQYAMRVENLAMAQERNRIARDIHDSLGHSLTALNIQLEGGLKLWKTDPAKAQAFLQDAKRLGSLALQEVRRSVTAMRSDPLQGQSLEQAIAILCSDMQKSTSINPTVHIALDVPLPIDLSTTLYRIIQEALTNIRKHANATQIAIDLRATPQAIELTIQDDGQGFDLEKNQTGFGLQSMRERTLACGGHFELHSQLGGGCQIRIQIPLQLRELEILNRSRF